MSNSMFSTRLLQSLHLIVSQWGFRRCYRSLKPEETTMPWSTSQSTTEIAAAVAAATAATVATAAPTKARRKPAGRRGSRPFGAARTEGNQASGRRNLMEEEFLKDSECPLCCTSLVLQPHAALEPCGHKVCMSCLCRLGLSKAHTQYVACPQCEKSTVSHKQFGFCKDVDEGKTITEIGTIEHIKPIGRNVEENPSALKDPFRHWVMYTLPHNPDAEQGILYLAVAEKSSGKFRSFTAPFVNSQGFTETDAAVQIFRELSEIVFPTGRVVGSINHSILVTDLIEQALSSDIATDLLYALGRGEILQPEERGTLSASSSGRTRSSFMASWIAAELLRFSSPSRFKQLSCFQTFVGSMVHGFGAQQRAIDVLSDLCLSCSYSHLQRLKERQKIEDLRVERELRHNVFLRYSTDNFDTKKGGKDAGCVSHTISSIGVYDEQDHRKFGLCQQEPSNRIDRKDESFAEARDRLGENHCESFVGIRKTDRSVFSFYKLRHIEYVIDLHLPSIEECKEKLANKNFHEWKKSYSIRKNLGIDIHPRKRYDQSGDRIPFLPRRFADGVKPADYWDELVEDGSTLLSRNKMIVDVPNEVNLGATSTVKGMMEKLVHLNSTQLASWQRDGTHGEEPPVAELMIPWCLDGQLAAKALRIIAEDALSEDPQLQRVRPFAGGFHTVKKTIERMNMIFEAIVSSLIKPFRATTKQASHFFDPHDPNDFEEEIIGMVVALYKSACDDFSKSTGRLSFSADDVHRSMIRRSKECASAMHFHNYLGFVTVYFILRDAEKCDSIDLFFSGIRLALPLFCASHATDYVRICHDILIWSETASEANLRLFQEYCFSCITADGKSIFMDKAQEKVNGYLRAEVGKIWQPGYEKKLYQACVDMDRKLRIKRDLRDAKGLRANKSSGAFNQQKIAVGIEYASVRVAVDEMQLWKEQKPFMVRSARGSMAEAPTDKLLSINGSPLRSEVLMVLSIGVARNNEYYDKFDDCEVPVVARPESGDEGVNLERIRSQENECKEEFNRRKILATSTNKSALKSAARKRKRPLLAEIRFTRDHLGDRFPADIDLDRLERASASLDAIVDALIACRKIWKTENNGRIPVSDDVFADSRSDRATRSRELRDNHFGMLEHSVLRQFRHQIEFK